MSSDDLDQSLKAHYEAATSRGEEAIQRVRKAVEAEAQAVNAPPAATAWRRWGAAVAVAAVVAFFAGVGITRAVIAEDRLERVAKEVAFTYSLQLDDDVPVEHYEQLPFVLNRLDQLRFTPVKSQSPHLKGFKLKGVSYCTFGDRLALQLHLEDEVSRFPLTLYQFLPSEVEDGIKGEKQFTFRGVGVRVWIEQDLVMALAYHDRTADVIPESVPYRSRRSRR